eukprot:CAMPEP_0168330078 /NCGR_PEP_ID=MMETSP0213-20121227/7496_1 /TAXON_ID=151035 /ORGANISM="Euplotes harpa, Strain FSP1.4" /LENGTH=108 /DNA_ID=CAMNT_0008333539 /DNA_START=9 /DNA_END=335 /DNA_ORIENTATION=-
MERGKLRVLCLHGFYNNAEFMRYQMAYYEQVFRDHVEFEFMNAPYEIQYLYDDFITQKFQGPFYAWAEFDLDKKILIGCIESMNFVIDYINKHGPYDGIAGFSQGTLI